MARTLVNKRPRALTEDHDVPNGVASLKSRSKRPRHASPQDSTRDSSVDPRSAPSDDDGDDSEAESRDGHDEVDEAVFMRATQHVTKHLQDSQEKQNTPAEAGIIEEVRCTNFMCHEQLTVTLGPLINFITGHNGSGKSAVLTAITLCLGGKATATNRGQNLKSFIKEGRDYCMLSVRLRNRGGSGFKHDQYGDSIIVERHFSKTGSPHFKIKDQNGRIVSQKKSELEDIVDAFALQVDNPMNVLTQDMARQFLNDSNPKEKYKFFLQGTQLETLSRDYLQIQHELEEQEAKAQTLESDLDVFRKKAERAVEKAKAAQNLQSMRAKERMLAHQAAWAHVQEHEQILADWEDEVEKANQEIATKTAEADNQSQRYTRADQASESANKEVEECQAEIEPAEQDLEEHKSKLQEGKTALIQAKSQTRQAMEKVKAKNSLIRNRQKEIDDLRKRQAEADDGLYDKKLQELQDAQAACEQAKQTLQKHNDSVSQIDNDLKAAQDAKQRATRVIMSKQAEVKQSQANITKLERGQRNWIDSFPANLDQLLRAIQNEKGFTERPVGPMGHYIELKKPEWGSILEKVLGPTLNGFVVTSKKDQVILSNLMKRVGYNAAVYIGRNDQVDTSRNEPDASLVTWMRVLKINNNLVKNQLITAQSIEQVVLIEDRTEGWNFMQTGGPAMKNVGLCFTMMDNNPRKGHVIKKNEQSGSLSLQPVGQYGGQPRMQTDKGQEIRHETQTLERLQREALALEENSRELQKDVDACKTRTREHGIEKRRLTREFQEAQNRVEQLETELSDATPDAAAIDQLQEEVATAQEELKFEEGQYEDAVGEEERLNSKQKDLQNEVNQAHSLLEDLRARLAKLQVRLKTVADRREQALRSKNLAIEEVGKAEERKTAWEEKCQTKRNDVQEFIEQAESICPRVEVPAGATFESLGNKLARLQKTREENEKQLGGSEEELVRAANQAKERHKQAREQLHSVQAVRAYLKGSLENRQLRWKRFRQDISLRARVTFNYLLSERQFRGSLNIDHKSKQLDIHVQPDITVNSNTGRQTKTLSGGEKSFSTICLLLALWDAMGSPIRCLDEFDVFMDSVNREASMKLMVQAARRAIGRQYILISPQAMGNLPRMDDVTIIRMRDPERGQTTLNFERRR